MWKNKLYFRADDGVHGEELWVSDGTADGTRMLKDLVELPVDVAKQGRPLIPFNDGLYFAYADDGHGEELWRYSEETNDLQLLKDIAVR